MKKSFNTVDELIKFLESEVKEASAKKEKEKTKSRFEQYEEATEKLLMDIFKITVADAEDRKAKTACGIAKGCAEYFVATNEKIRPQDLQLSDIYDNKTGKMFGWAQELLHRAPNTFTTWFVEEQKKAADKMKAKSTPPPAEPKGEDKKGPTILKRNPNVDADINAYRTDKRMQLELVLPGLVPDSINVDYKPEENLILVRGKGRPTDFFGNDQFVEGFVNKDVDISFSVPKKLDGKKIAATYDSGIVNISLPFKATPKAEVFNIKIK